MAKLIQYQGKIYQTPTILINTLIDKGYIFKVCLTANKDYDGTVKQYRLYDNRDECFICFTKYQAKKHLTDDQLRLNKLHDTIKKLMIRGNKDFGQVIADQKELNRLCNNDIVIDTMHNSILKIGLTTW